MWTLVGQTSSFTIMETGHSERPLQTPLPATTSESGEWCGLITTMTGLWTSSWPVISQTPSIVSIITITMANSHAFSRTSLPVKNGPRETVAEMAAQHGETMTMTDSSTSLYMLVMIVRTDFIITMVMEASVRSAQVRYFPTRRARNPADVLGGILTTTATSICS